MKTLEEITTIEWLNFYHYARSSSNDRTKVFDKIMSSTEIAVELKKAIIREKVVGEVKFSTNLVATGEYDEHEEYEEQTYYASCEITDDIPYLIIPKNS